jgi:hypothetical protein
MIFKPSEPGLESGSSAVVSIVSSHNEVISCSEQQDPLTQPKPPVSLWPASEQSPASAPTSQISALIAATICWRQPHTRWTSIVMRLNDRRTVSRPCSRAAWQCRGLQQMQRTCLEIFDQSIEDVAHKPRDLLRYKTVVEVAEVQRDLYVDATTSSSRSLEQHGSGRHASIADWAPRT